MQFDNPQNWFHVKSEWEKNHEISTLWTATMTSPTRTSQSPILRPDDAGFSRGNYFLKKNSTFLGDKNLTFCLLPSRIYVEIDRARWSLNYSGKIERFYCRSYFTWNKFGKFRGSKTAIWVLWRPWSFLLRIFHVWKQKISKFRVAKLISLHVKSG